MAVLARLKIAANQRLDIPDITAFDAYSAGDWRGFMTAMVGQKPYLIRGFEVFQPNTLIGNPAGTVDVTIVDSMLWWSAGDAGSFFTALPEAENKSVTLITDATNYIEMSLTILSTAQDARALWDPGANGGNGGEFTQVVDTENYLDVDITRNNTGFSEDKIPIAKIVVNSSNNVVSITDCRPMMFRLGAGGNVPDPLNDYIWRDDPVGFNRTDTPTTMVSPLDPNVFRGADKNIQSFKEWMDAVMSRLKEIDGGSKWFQATGGGGGGGSGGSLSLTNLFLDSQAGHSPFPDRKVSLAWSKNNDNVLRSENAPSYSAPVRWGANFGQLKWALGGSFVSASNRAYSTFTFSQAVADGQNIYLQLQRDASLNGDPIVHFENLSGVTGFASAFSAGAFTGIACGDYVRKESNTVYQYYRVAELRVAAGTPFTNGTVEGTVADATVGYLLLETHDGPIATTDEPYRFFRKNYQNSDLIVSTVGLLDTSRYWLGRRIGAMFYFRDYGDMQPGEETEILNDHDGILRGGDNGLVINRAFDSVYDLTTGYSLKGGGTTTLVTLLRRLADNTVGTPSNADNSGSLLAYTINAPIGLIADGSSIWVRLGTTAGALSGGDVTDVTTDNVWQVRTAANAPLRSYDNNNVFQVARKLTVDGNEVLLFNDGQMLDATGIWFNNSISFTGDLFLKSLTQNSVLFIETTNGEVGENNSEFFWDNTGGLDSLGLLGVRNFRIGQSSTEDYVTQDVARDVTLFGSLGSFTVKVGNSGSTVYIPGSLIVVGTTTAISTTNLLVDDKLISLGVGSLLNGGNGAGVEVADDTRLAASIASISGQPYISITYAAPHGYVLGDIVGVASNAAVGGVTAGDISGSYTVVTTGSLAGDAEVISTTVLRVWTGVNATSTASLSLSPPTTSIRTFVAPWSIRVGDSSGAYSGGITSWVFRVKSQATAPTLTPVSSYGVVPTAHSTNMQSTRIAFVNNDNVGPSGGDTTLNFSANLAWDGSALIVGGNVLPLAANAHSVGSTALPWLSAHLGGTAGLVVHNDLTDTLKVSINFSGSYARLITDAASFLQLTTGANDGIRVADTGAVSIGSAAPSAYRLTVGLAADTASTGGILWGGGLSNIYRSAADTLKTDGNFIVAGSLTVGSTTIGGALNLNYASTKTANYTVLTTDCVVPFDTTASGSNVTATLPAVTAGNKGQLLMIKDVSGAVNLLNKAVVITPNGADSIDGVNSSITMTIPYFSLTLVSNGVSGWTLH